MNTLLAKARTEINREAPRSPSWLWQSMFPKGGSGSITAGSVIDLSVDLSKEFAQESKQKLWKMTTTGDGGVIYYFEIKEKPRVRAHRSEPKPPQYKSAEKEDQPSFPDLLTGLTRQIENLSRLAKGWDGEDALPIDSQTCDRAEDFLFLHMVEFLENKRTAALPKVRGLPDGSIDLFWKTPEFRFLVNIPVKKNAAATFFGEYFGDTRARGSVEPGKTCSILIDYLNRE